MYKLHSINASIFLSGIIPPHSPPASADTKNDPQRVQGCPTGIPALVLRPLLFSLNFLMLTKEKRWTLPLLFVYINYRMHRVWCFQLLLFSKNMLLFFWILWPVSTDLKSPGALLKHRWQKKMKPVSSQCCPLPIPLACICNFHWMSLQTCGPHLTQNAANWCPNCITTIKSTCNSAKHQKQTDYVFGHVQSLQVVECLCDVWYCGSLPPDVQSQDAPEKQQLIEGSLSSQPNAIIVHGLSSSIGMQMCSKVIQACDQQGNRLN